MITFEGLFVPSITIVLPLGGADLSGVVMLMVVGSALYGASAAAAAEVGAEPEDAAVELPPLDEAADEADVVEELDDPQAATARASTRVPMIATNTSGRPPLRRFSFVMCVSFPM
jgi:hypothetical protein